MNRVFFRTSLLLALAAMATPASAVIHCVADETQFRAALTAIGSGGSGDQDIRLTRRVFFNGTAVFGGTIEGGANEVRISGGWDAGCANQLRDPRSTVLDAQHLSPVLSINGARLLIAVSNLTLRNGQAASAPVGLKVYNSFGSIDVHDVIVHGHRATASQYNGGTAITLDSSSGNIRLRNALVYDNEGVTLFGFPLVDVLFTSLGPNPDRQFTVTNSTIDGGAGTGSLALRMQSDGHFDLFNNVIRGEASFNRSIGGSGAPTLPRIRRVFNHMLAPVYGEGTPPVIVLETGNETGDPQLHPSTYEPLPGSPVVNTGLGNPPGGESTHDVYGRPRVAFTYIDRGALESQTLPPLIFSNGFE